MRFLFLSPEFGRESNVIDEFSNLLDSYLFPSLECKLDLIGMHNTLYCMYKLNVKIRCLATSKSLVYSPK